MKLADLFDRGVPESASELAVSGVTADSRRVRPGTVFAALAGMQAHGRDHVADAIGRGAVAVLSAGDLKADPGIPHIVDAVPRLALARAAARLHPHQPQTIAAVTGTNGKSSTVDFLRQIWTHAGRRAASLGTLGAIGPEGVVDLGHTTPDPVAIHQTLEALAGQGVTHVAMEASSHGLDQHRLDAVRLAAGAFTNLTQDHLDYHGTMDAYRQAKLRLWDLVPRGAPAVVNVDAIAAPDFKARAIERGLSLVTCGWRATDLKIVEVWPRPAGQRLDLRWKGRSFMVDLPLIGEFQALNAVTAAALALALGEDIEAVIGGLERLRTVRGRIEHVGATSSGAQVFVDYAHTPDGLDVLLRAARPHAPGRIVLVFGCGGDRDRTKRPLMGQVARRHGDVVIVTDDNPRTEDAAAIRSAIMEAVPEALEIGDRGEAIRAAVNMLTAGDCLLIAGKGHETGQIVGTVVHPFSDQEAAAAALHAAGGVVGAGLHA